MAENNKSREIENKRVQEISNFKKKIEQIRKDVLRFLPFALVPFILLFVKFLHVPFFYWILISLVCFVPLTIWYGTYNFKSIKAWENAVIFKMEKPQWIRKPGWTLIFRPFQKIKFQEMWELEVNIPPQQILIKDGTVITADGTIYARVYDAYKVSVNVKDPFEMLVDKGQAILRDLCAPLTTEKINELKTGTDKTDLEDKIRDRLNEEICYDPIEAKSIREAKRRFDLRDPDYNKDEGWGVMIKRFQIITLDPPKEVKEAMQAKDVATHKVEAQLITADGNAKALKIRTDAIKENDPNYFFTSLEALREMPGATVIISGDDGVTAKMISLVKGIKGKES